MKAQLTRYQHLLCEQEKGEQQRTSDASVPSPMEAQRQYATGTSPETSSSPTSMPFFVAMKLQSSSSVYCFSQQMFFFPAEKIFIRLLVFQN
jgi:hypothetical protein